MGRIDVFVVYVLCFAADSVQQRLFALFKLRLVAAFDSLAQSKIGVARKFRVYRQVNKPSVVRRQLHRELNAVARALLCCGVFFVLGGREDFRENASELDFAENTARFYVREHLFEVADSHREVLHFAETLVNLLEPLTDEREAVVQLFFKTLVELFVNGIAHFLKLTVVVRLNVVEPLFNGFANTLKLAAVRRCKALQTVFEHSAHRAYGILRLRAQLLPQLALLTGDIRAYLPRKILFVDAFIILNQN